jgi:hypothetical protein
LKINGKLKLGKNVSIRVRNGFYSEAPENKISQLTEKYLFMHGFMWNGIQLFPNMFGQGGDGGDSSDENNGSYIINTNPRLYNGVGGPGGGGFGGGSGGVNINGYNLFFGSNNGGYASQGGRGWNARHTPGGTGGSGGGKKNLGEHGGSGTDFTYASGGGGGGGNVGNGGFGGNGDITYQNGGRGGGGGGYGGGILSIFAHSLAYDENAPPKFIVSGQKGGDGEKSGENGEGGLLIIEAAHYTQSTSHYNLYASTYGEHIVPSNNGGHGIVSGSPQKVFVYK